VIGQANLEGIKTSGLPPPQIYKQVSNILKFNKEFSIIFSLSKL
jgi:hypothetical protein